MSWILTLALAVLSAAGQSRPAELDSLLSRTKLSGELRAWCRAEFTPGSRGAFAVAMMTADGGRYVAIEPDGRPTPLGSFARTPDLTCYSRTEAQKLARSIQQSETIHGTVTPRWNGTVVCAFTADTMAECWQYSPADRRFIKVGAWVT